QLLPFYWAPLTLLLTHRFLETHRKRHFAGALVTAVAQYYASIYLGTILVVTVGVFGAVHLLAERRGKERLVFVTDFRLLRLFLVGGALAALALAPLALAYLRTTH